MVKNNKEDEDREVKTTSTCNANDVPLEEMSEVTSEWDKNEKILQNKVHTEEEGESTSLEIDREKHELEEDSEDNKNKSVTQSKIEKS